MKGNNIEFKNKLINVKYDIKYSYIAGIVLTANDTQYIRSGRVNMKGSYIVLRNKELYLISFKLHSKDEFKLLLNKKEILRIQTILRSGKYTIIPKRLFNIRGLFKIEICICVGLKNYDVREKIKKREMEQQVLKIHNEYVY